MELFNTYFGCPKCGHPKTYRKFIPKDEQSFGAFVGYCSHCGYMMSPVEFESRRRQMIFRYSGNQVEFSLNKAGTHSVERDDSRYYVSKNYAQGCNENSILFQAIARVLGEDKTLDAFHKYGVETCLWSHREFASIFWYKDFDCKNIAYRIMQYDKDGHSQKKGTITKSLDVENCNRYCLFGRHLLELPDAANKPICVVESEKTALIASIAYPNAIWMATGSCYYLTKEKIDFPTNNLCLFPDPDVKGERSGNWYRMAEHCTWLKGARVSHFMDNYCKAKNKATYFDIADYIVENYNPDMANNNLETFDKLIQ